MLTIGINAGAIGVLTAGDAYKTAFDLSYRAGQIDGVALRTGLKQAIRGQAARVVIEKRPGWGPAADAIREAIDPLGLPVQFVDESRWRRGLALAEFQQAPVRRARALFPDADLKEAHVARASALLLAHWVVAGRSSRTLTLPGRDSQSSTRARARGNDGRLW